MEAATLIERVWKIASWSLAVICLSGVILWTLNLWYSGEVHWLDKHGRLFGMAVEGGRLVLTRQTGILGSNQRAQLQRVYHFGAGPYRRRGIDASDYDYWGTMIFPGDPIKNDRITRRRSIGGLAWESGGKVDTGRAVSSPMEMPDVGGPFHGGVVTYGPSWIPPTPMAKDGETLIDPWCFLTIPLWLITLLTMPSTGWLFRREFVRRRSDLRLRSGRCAKCGYDLRASLGRCSECGAVIEAAQMQHDFSRKEILVTEFKDH